MRDGFRPTPEELASILAAHSRWLFFDPTGCKADLSEADLSGANLYGADLSGAKLSGADLSEADLAVAKLSGANLYGANLYGADLSGANLYGADLHGAKIDPLAAARTEILPREGEVIGWKKCRGGKLVKLRVPPASPRSNSTGRKCRAGWVEVLEITGPDGIGTSDSATSRHDGSIRYVVGKTVKADKWCEDRWQECAGGIHFFLTREEAEAY